MTKPEFEWIAFNGGEAYVPKGAGPERRVAFASLSGAVYVGNGDGKVAGYRPKARAERAIANIASALATPASDGLPEGWKGYSATRNDGLEVRLFADNYVTTWSSEPRPATMSLSEACLAANERSPAVKPEAPAKWSFNEHTREWTRTADGTVVRQLATVKLWGVGTDESNDWLAAFPTAEEAMAWADRERPVA